MRNFFSLLIMVVVFLGCNDNGSRKNKNLLPPARGRAGEVIVVMDSSQWAGPVGREIKNAFRAEIEGLPREEYLFKLNRVDPGKFNDVLKSSKNLLFVMTLDNNKSGSKIVRNYFTKSSLSKIKKDPGLFVHTATDEFAKGQVVMYLFGQDEETLIKNLQEHRSQLQNFFNKEENKRLHVGLYKAEESKGFTNMLQKEHECSMRIPFGYKLAVNEPGFVWFRQMNAESDKDIFITYRPYTSEEAFTKEAIIDLRDSIAQQQLFEDPEFPETHVVTETKVPFIPVTTQRVNFNGNYAIKTTGLWKTSNMSMGGPFISYTLVDQELGRLYYIEGFLYSPGKNQREFMRELNVILSTFKIQEQLNSSGN